MTPANCPSPHQRGAGYIRYSSDKQADSFSLEAQKQQILAHAAKDGVVVVDLFTDESQSAYRQKNRPGIRAMLEAARRGDFEILYIHKVDRLARRVKWALEIVEQLVSLKVVIIAARLDRARHLIRTSRSNSIILLL